MAIMVMMKCKRRDIIGSKSHVSWDGNGFGALLVGNVYCGFDDC